MRRIVRSTAFVRQEHGEIMGIVCVCREMVPEDYKRGSGDEVVQEGVEALVARPRAALRRKDNSANKRDEKEVA
jgi:hypothetical protein